MGGGRDAPRDPGYINDPNQNMSQMIVDIIRIPNLLQDMYLKILSKLQEESG